MVGPLSFLMGIVPVGDSVVAVDMLQDTSSMENANITAVFNDIGLIIHEKVYRSILTKKGAACCALSISLQV